MTTIRKNIMDLLDEKALTARDLSQQLHIAEKEVHSHLEHVSRTARTRQKQLLVLPFSCLICGYAFSNRKRFTRPGKCPVCRGTHIQEPEFIIRSV